MTQRAVVKLVNRRMLDHHFYDRRNREQVADAMLFNQPPHLLGVKFGRAQQDGFGAASDVWRDMGAGPMRQGCYHQRSIVYREPRH